MRMMLRITLTRVLLYVALIAGFVSFPIVTRGQTVTQNAQNLNIGFNGPDAQFPYSDIFFAATAAYYQTLGRTPPGNRHCHAYLSWDIAEHAVGSGNIAVEGTRSWFEDWLNHAEGHCDEALITFKWISGVSAVGTGNSPTEPPAPADYEAAFTAFVGTSWAYTGWTGSFAYTPWNEPNNGSGSGDGMTIVLDPHLAADYYLAIRKHCSPPGCTVASGDFGSNGNLDVGFVQNCSNDSAALCSNATYMDEYKHYLVNDAPSYGFTSSFRPEIFAFHGWDDVNDYINGSPQCISTADKDCTAWAVLNSMSEDTWTGVNIWDTEVGAGQNPQTNPDTITQACAASFLLRLTATVSPRISRIYYTRPDETDGEHWSLFDSTGAEKPSFTILADRDSAYTPPAGGEGCPLPKSQGTPATTLSLTANPSTVVAGQPTTLTATLAVASGSLSATNGLAIDFQTTEGNYTGILSNGVATATFYPYATAAYGDTQAVSAMLAPVNSFGPSSASAMVSISTPGGAGGSLLQGQYAFLLRGITGLGSAADPNPKVAGAGSLKFDGQGNITGEEDFNAGIREFQNMAVTGTYTVGLNGQGTLTLQTPLGAQHFDLFLPAGTAAAPAVGSIVETDGAFVSAMGPILQQSAQAFTANGLENSYVLQLAGELDCGTCAAATQATPVSVGGVVNLNVGLTGAISGTVDQSIGTTTVQDLGISGTMDMPDAFGRLTLQLTAPNEPSQEPTDFVAYVIDAAHIFLLSTDPRASSILLSGKAVAAP